MERKMAPKRFYFLSALLAISLVCSTCAAGDALYSGQRLAPGELLVQGGYTLAMQLDCNLVLYSSTVVWSSGTYSKGINCFAYLTFEGYLGVYDGSGVILWASGVPLATSYYVLILQPDRNLVIYGPARWATGTYVTTAGFSQSAINATKINP